MTLLVDCSTCPAKPRACGDCSVGFLLGPAAGLASSDEPFDEPFDEPSVTASVTADPALSDAIATFAGEGMLPHLRVVPDQAKRAG